MVVGVGWWWYVYADIISVNGEMGGRVIGLKGYSSITISLIDDANESYLDGEFRSLCPSFNRIILRSNVSNYGQRLLVFTQLCPLELYGMCKHRYDELYSK